MNHEPPAANSGIKRHISHESRKPLSPDCRLHRLIKEQKAIIELKSACIREKFSDAGASDCRWYRMKSRLFWTKLPVFDFKSLLQPKHRH